MYLIKKTNTFAGVLYFGKNQALFAAKNYILTNFLT